ncbi:TPA: hypothetical protein QCY03_003703 [Bacillus tropicus]|nr:hypothetical protein [Bacillus tropicus]
MNHPSTESTSNKKSIGTIIARLIKLTTLIGGCITILLFIESKVENHQKEKTSAEIDTFLANYSKKSLVALNNGSISDIEDFIDKNSQYYTGMNNYVHDEFSAGRQYHSIEIQLSETPKEITSSEYKITTSEEYIYTSGKEKVKEKVKNRCYKVKIIDNNIQISAILDKGERIK